jgi:CBS domain-containing protein
VGLRSDAIACEIEDVRPREVGTIGAENSTCIADDVPLNSIDPSLWQTHGIAVVVRRDGRFLGIVSARQLMRQERLELLRPVHTVVRSKLHVDEGASIHDVALEMAHHAVRSLPIVDRSGHFVALVHDTELLHSLSVLQP